MYCWKEKATVNTLTLDGAFGELLCFLFFFPFAFIGLFAPLVFFCCFDIDADSVYLFCPVDLVFFLKMREKKNRQQSSMASSTKLHTIGGVSPAVATGGAMRSTSGECIVWRTYQTYFGSLSSPRETPNGLHSRCGLSMRQGVEECTHQSLRKHK